MFEEKTQIKITERANSIREFNDLIKKYDIFQVNPDLKLHPLSRNNMEQVEWITEYERNK